MGVWSFNLMKYPQHECSSPWTQGRKLQRDDYNRIKKTQVVRMRDASSQIIPLRRENKSLVFFTWHKAIRCNSPVSQAATSVPAHLWCSSHGRKSRMWKKLNTSPHSLLFGLIHSENFLPSPPPPLSFLCLTDKLDNEGVSRPTWKCWICFRRFPDGEIPAQQWVFNNGKQQAWIRLRKVSI